MDEIVGDDDDALDALLDVVHHMLQIQDAKDTREARIRFLVSGLLEVWLSPLISGVRFHLASSPFFYASLHCPRPSITHFPFNAPIHRLF